MENKMMTRCSVKGKVEARLIHILLRGDTGQGFIGGDNEECGATLQG